MAKSCEVFIATADEEVRNAGNKNNVITMSCFMNVTVTNQHLQDSYEHVIDASVGCDL